MVSNLILAYIPFRRLYKENEWIRFKTLEGHLFLSKRYNVLRYTKSFCFFCSTAYYCPKDVKEEELFERTNRRIFYGKLNKRKTVLQSFRPFKLCELKRFNTVLDLKQVHYSYGIRTYQLREVFKHKKSNHFKTVYNKWMKWNWIT